MKTKEIEKIIPPPAPHMVGDGFRVHNFFPGEGDFPLNRMSPFFLMDYNSKVEFSPRENPRGVGVHPHRGFETVTIAYQGAVSHHDSYGNHGTIYKGDIQWMTAASGVLHKEYHEKEFSSKGGVFQMVQLWINLPAKEKMSAPKYQPITNDMLGKYLLSENAGRVEVIAGEYNGVKGPASTFSPVEMYNAYLNKNSEANFSFPSHYNTGLVVIEGSVIVNGKERVAQDNFVLFGNSGENFSIKAEEESIILILSGEPINEPIAAYGPFLMNTKQEIIQAYQDFNDGKFGHLDD